MGVEPRMLKVAQEVPPVQVTEVVAAPYTPAPPFETRRFDEDGWLVVARPHQVKVVLVPPTWAPYVAGMLAGKFVYVMVVVATEESAFVPFPYRSSEEVKVV